MTFIQTTELPNYPECVKDPNGRRTLKGNESFKHLNNNTATLCASHCKEQKNIFSGTKKNLCICGNEFQRGIRVSNNCETGCPGDEDENCGGTDSVSPRRTGYEEEMALTSKSTGQKTSSKIAVTSLPVTSSVKASFTHESTGITTSVSRFPKARSIDSTEGSQMTALYITLPVVVIVAGTVALIVCLILRYKRQKDEAVSKYEQDVDYRTQNLEVTAQNTNGDDRCDADYSTVSGLNDTLENNQDYDKLNAKQATSTRTHAIYSHLKLETGILNSNTTDNTYSHIGSASKVCINKTDNAYNTVHFSQRAGNTGAPSLC